MDRIITMSVVFRYKIRKFLQRSPGCGPRSQLFLPQRLCGNSFLLFSPASTEGPHTSTKLWTFWTEFRISFHAGSTVSGLGTGREGLPSQGLGQLLGEERTTERCRWGSGPCALCLQLWWPSPPARLHFAPSPFPEQSLLPPGIDRQRRALWIHSGGPRRDGGR